MIKERTKYLSPSALSCWKNDKEEFYIRYLAKDRPIRSPQTQPMSVGSAFDAYVKAYLYEEIFGIKDSEFAFEKLFPDQVEEHNRDFALSAGAICMEAYRCSGVLADLLLMLQKSFTEPKFEITISDTVSCNLVGVPLLGKPDLLFHLETEEGVTPIILDWKVNGYCSKASPNKGYVVVRDGWVGAGAASKHHKDCIPMVKNGVMVNIAEPFDFYAPQWAGQLSTYFWLEGEPVGTQAICIIHQLACNKEKGQIRIADLRGSISREFQEELFNDYVACWKDVADWQDQRLEVVAGQFSDVGAASELFRDMCR